MEKCVFGTKNGVLHYVLKRELAAPRKNLDFEWEICVKEHGGRAARCMGSVPVAEMIASEARRRPPQDHPKTKTRPPIEKVSFFIKNVDFSLEKCRFGAHRGVLHYVLMRERVTFRKNDHFDDAFHVASTDIESSIKPAT